MQVEKRSIDFIPPSERHGQPGSLFFIWVGANMNITTIASGVLPVVKHLPGHGLGELLPALTRPRGLRAGNAAEGNGARFAAVQAAHGHLHRENACGGNNGLETRRGSFVGLFGHLGLSIRRVKKPVRTPPPPCERRTGDASVRGWHAGGRKRKAPP